MSACKFPDHHTSSGGGSVLPALIALAVAAAAVVLVVQAIVTWVAAHLLLILTPVTLGMAALLLVPTIRLAKAGPAGWRNWPRAKWAHLRWRWLARNLGLAYPDRHRRRLLRPRVPASTSV